MSLVSRVVKLERRVMPPIKPVKVVFTGEGQSEFVPILNSGCEPSSAEELTILVKFIQPYLGGKMESN
jgi:hypothetical protein